MSMTLGGITRTVALWVMIVCAGIADVLLYLQGQIIWGTFWSVIILLVGGYELYAYFFSAHKKTISNIYRDFIKAHPFWGYGILVLLCVALNALILHLAVW
jgi:hypothetical protein